MPRDSSGVYTLPSSAFIAATIAYSNSVNDDFNDIADALTQSLAANGVSDMVAPLRFTSTNDSTTEPTISFRGDTNTGIRRAAEDRIVFICDGIVVANVSAGILSFGVTRSLFCNSLTIDGVANQGFARNVATLFIQSAAPTGWTRTTASNKGLRLVTATAGSGGTLAWNSVMTTVSTSVVVDSTVVTIAQMGAHQHFVANNTASGTLRILAADNMLQASINSGGVQSMLLTGTTGATPTLAVISSVGENQGHTHGFYFGNLDFNVQYVDCIIATKS